MAGPKCHLLRSGCICHQEAGDGKQKEPGEGDRCAPVPRPEARNDATVMVCGRIIGYGVQMLL